MSDAGLPVWSLEPDWTDDVTERLEWLTSVLPSPIGAEQRIAVRATPRRIIQMSFLLGEAERSYLDLILSRALATDWMMPLWFDRGVLTAPSNGAILTLDTRFREFAVGQEVLVMGDDFLSWSRATITALSDDGLVVAPPVAPWPMGSSVYPLRRSRLPASQMVRGLSTRVGRLDLDAVVTSSNPLSFGVESLTEYLGSPVLLAQPEKADALEYTYSNEYDVHDPGTGLPAYAATRQYSFTAEQHSWVLSGRQESYEFRQFLYRLAGRQKMLWMPTFSDDFRVTRSARIGDEVVTISKVGFELTGGPTPGRDLLLIGSEIISITGVDLPPSPREETITLGQPLTESVPKDTRLSFVRAMRLDQDSIELVHTTDTDGITQCGLALRSFLPTRDPSGAIDVPLEL